ncbi:MAG: hypothetical protein ACREV8_00105 [Gammaproteobacteria bacterium]
MPAEWSAARSARIFGRRGSEVYCTVDVSGPEDFDPTSRAHLTALEQTGRRPSPQCVLAQTLSLMLDRFDACPKGRLGLV